MNYAEVVFNIPVDRSFIYKLPSNSPGDMGYRVMAPFGAKKKMGCIISVKSEVPDGTFKIKEIDRIIDEKPLFDDNLLGLAIWMSRMYLCSLGEALLTILPSGRRETETMDLYTQEAMERGSDFILAAQQRQAIDTILSSRTGTYYLTGVTGSGKTEVFLQVAKALNAEGKGIIYLVPEISLIHQIVEAFALVLGREAAVFHSGMTSSQRLKEWVRLYEGKVNIVVGARSAVFTPVKNLGLIVLDEEHESAYKSNATPRYHARQVAAQRCRTEDALFVMGSATPSMEAYHRMISGKLTRLDLPRRISGGTLPAIEVVDMKREKGVLSQRLMQEIQRVHSEGRQTILFLNRRGFAHFFSCRSCGYEMKCSRCSVSLTYHKKNDTMICHYCGLRSRPVDVCPECGSLDVGYHGFGTEKIQEEIGKTFPELIIKRIDTDTMRRKADLQRALSAFRRGEIHMLLGTQMVAKGLNFPGVKLVGIVAADVGMQLPDFRALERTFSLIVQVSGRAGRMIPDGKVIVQTFRPDNPVIKRITRGEYEDFYREELESRKMLQFPPYVRLIRLVLRGKNQERVIKAADRFRVVISECGEHGVEILGPVECPFSTIAGNHRYHLLFRGRKFQKTHALVKRVYSKFRIPPEIHMEIDVDPLSLL